MSKKILKWKNGELNTQFFLPDVVNIFTDASVDSERGIACLALAIVYTNENYEDHVYTHPSTKICEIPSSFEGEQLALMNGLMTYFSKATDLSPMKINIFTDSLATVQAVRKKKKMRFANTDNLSSKDVNDMISTAAKVCNINSISVYHVKAHIKKIKDMRKKFAEHNGMALSKYDAFQLLKYNNFVDRDANVNLRSDIENLELHRLNDKDLISDIHTDNR